MKKITINFNIKYIWFDSTSYNVITVIDTEFYRPAEGDYLRGDNTKALSKLGWEPKHSFSDLVKLMVEHDLQ